MKIVKMESAHVAQIAELEKRCFSDPWSEKSIAYELTLRISYWLVALDGETVAGYIGSQSVMGESDMMNVAVSPDYRRQGIGEALVKTLCDDLKAQGNTCITLEVRVSNAPAVALYEKLGFREVGRRPNYYHNPKEDALIMRKELGA